MKKITVQNIEEFVGDSELIFISRYMDVQPSHEMAFQSWEEYQTNNRAAFAIAYGGENIFLKFYVNEQYLNSSIRDINGDVHKDNCVEFFISFGAEYYNLEFNCLGSVKIGYGNGRHGRVLLSEEIIKKIGMHITIDSNRQSSKDYLYWELLVNIPKEIFCFSSIGQFKGITCRANFYSCGDELPKPHYLSWSEIKSEIPDFHQPEFFGELVFE